MIRETNRQSPVYLLQPRSTTDSYGDPILSWADPIRIRIPGGEIQRNSTEDKDVATGTQTDRLGKFLATGREVDIYRLIDESSRLEQDGKVWRVTGEPDLTIGVMSGNTHLSASLTRTTVGGPGGA